MPFDRQCSLWTGDVNSFFADRELIPIAQRGPHCVATVLAMLTGKRPEDFIGRVNTQDPVSWSASLQVHGMKLAYCPTDVRKLKHYLDELIALDDLFTLSYYTSLRADDILGDPDEEGWITGSHIVILHRDRILDPQSGTATDARVHDCIHFHTKRVFRVVPHDHARGL